MGPAGTRIHACTPQVRAQPFYRTYGSANSRHRSGANIVGIPAAMLDQNTVWSVLQETEFGHVWMVHLAVSAAKTGLRSLFM
jgi:hypothetical protein